MPDLAAFDWNDSDGDGYAETGLADTNGDGFYDVSAMDQDGNGTVETYLWDSNHDGLFDSLASDSDGDLVLDMTGIDSNQDGVLDVVVDPASHPVPDVRVNPQATLYPEYTIVGPSNGTSVVDDVTSLIPYADPYERVLIDRVIDSQNGMIDIWVEPDHRHHDDYDW